jgi:hypothetical protein
MGDEYAVTDQTVEKSANAFVLLGGTLAARRSPIPFVAPPALKVFSVEEADFVRC